MLEQTDKELTEREKKMLSTMFKIVEQFMYNFDVCDLDEYKTFSHNDLYTLSLKLDIDY